MDHNIQAIFLDVGNTLRVVVPDEAFQSQAKQQLAALIGAREPVGTLFERLNSRWKDYRKWSLENLTEACEQELWTRFMLPDYPLEQIAPLAGRLTRLWRDKDGRRIPRRDVKETVVELSHRGYCLGIIANTITETEIPDWIQTDGLTAYFSAVVLSSQVRYRKPGPEIYWEAARCTGIPSERSAYVGDNPLRDVVGTRKAGFGMVIILMEPVELEKDPPTGENRPDAIIHECRELLDIFPPRPVSRAE
jgi:putative hydrolase of the HAD superfamily